MMAVGFGLQEADRVRSTASLLQSNIRESKREEVGWRGGCHETEMQIKVSVCCTPKGECRDKGHLLKESYLGANDQALGPLSCSVIDQLTLKIVWPWLKNQGSLEGVNNRRLREPLSFLEGGPGWHISMFVTRGIHLFITHMDMDILWFMLIVLHYNTRTKVLTN